MLIVFSLVCRCAYCRSFAALHQTFTLFVVHGLGRDECLAPGSRTTRCPVSATWTAAGVGPHRPEFPTSPSRQPPSKAWSDVILCWRTEGGPDGPHGLDKAEALWEFAHMSSIVTCDSRRRLIIAAAVPGQEYLVDGLHVEPAPVKHAAPRQPRKWAGPKHSLGWHLKQLKDAGLKFEPIMNKEKVGPCPFLAV